MRYTAFYDQMNLNYPIKNDKEWNGIIFRPTRSTNLSNINLALFCILYCCLRASVRYDYVNIQIKIYGYIFYRLISFAQALQALKVKASFLYAFLYYRNISKFISVIYSNIFNVLLICVFLFKKNFFREKFTTSLYDK